LDFVDQQPQQLLALGAVEIVDDVADLPDEVGDAAAEQVAAGERGPAPPPGGRRHLRNLPGTDHATQSAR
jgi:hypothetical protein